MPSSPGNVNLSISRANAKLYIARIIGGGGTGDNIALAEEILLRAFIDWQNEKDWEFLLKDVSNNFTVDSCVTSSGLPTISAPVTAAFDGINIGITVTGTGIPASTTILSYTRGSDGTVNQITLSNNATGSSTVTLTFGGTIPVRIGVQDYNLPTDFYKHYGVRFTSTLKWPLMFVRPRDWNRITLDQTVQGSPELYTIFNPVSPLTQNKGVYRLRLYRIPSATDTLLVQYYRKFDALADPIDMDSVYLYKFLDYCRSLILSVKKGFDDPASYAAEAFQGLQKAKSSDEAVTEDQDVRMKSQMEMNNDFRMPLWSNGAFTPFPDYGW